MLLVKHQQSNRSLLTAVALLLLLTLASAADDLRAPPKVTLHTIVPTECTMYFSWQSLGIFYSHRKAGQSGPITRIISCTDEQRGSYKVLLWHLQALTITSSCCSSSLMHNATGS